MKKAKTNISFFGVTRELIKYSFECWPQGMSVYFLVGVTYGVMMGTGIFMMQAAFDAVTDLSTQNLTIREALRPIGLLIGFSMMREAIASMYWYHMNIIAKRMHGFMCKKIAIKTTKLDPICFESPSMLDDINKASEATHASFWAINGMIQAVILYLPFILIAAGYLFTLNPALVLVIVLACLPKLFGLVVRTKLYTNLEEVSAPLRRRTNFYEAAMVDREFFKETRMLGLFGFFKEKYLTSVRLLNRETWRAGRRAATLDLLTEMVTAVSYIATLYLLFDSLRAGLVTVGAFAAVLASVNELSRWLDTLINFHFARVAEDIGKVSFLIKFFGLPERTGEEVAVDWTSDIEFKNVSFAYPNSEKLSLRNVSLTMKAGQTIAIVGENGAGKSTFMKLLLGLYQPSTGEVVVGGKSLADVAMKDVVNGASAVFQQFQRYQLTLKENIQISAPVAKGDIWHVMEESGVLYESRSYPEGTETVLSREFDGVDLSGGQWQRIAIARGLYRMHDLIVLDEPTAAIDPLEENRLYSMFADISKGKTAVIVTHRMASAQIADQIIVLGEGEVIEVGSHHELLAANGTYAKMFEAQASWYIA